MRGFGWRDSLGRVLVVAVRREVRFEGYGGEGGVGGMVFVGCFWLSWCDLYSGLVGSRG
jgi:hypothetical protein